jgi:NAD(P)H-hydrate epimerase
MNILTAEEMGAVDRRTAEEFGIPLESLMEHAGNAVATFCLQQYGSESRTVVLCGKGNNGGDGFVAARRLARAGWLVRVVLLGRLEDVAGDAAIALRRLRDKASAVLVDEVADEIGLQT